MFLTYFKPEYQEYLKLESRPATFPPFNIDEETMSIPDKNRFKTCF